MLSPYSSKALAVFLSLCPDFVDLVTIEGELFKISFITPAGWEFWLDSDDEQVTVGLAEYHCHFGNFAGSTAEEDATEAASLIRELRSEKLVLAVWYRGDEYAGSAIIEADEAPTPFLSGSNQTFQIKKWGS
jgi:hypothetical protein